MAKPQAQIWHVSISRGQSPLKLRDFLVSQLGKERLSQIRQNLRNGQLAVNGQVTADGNEILKNNDVIHLYKYPRTPLPQLEDIELLHVDPALIVVNKPALMTTMPHAEEKHWGKARQRGQQTLLDYLPELLVNYELHQLRTRNFPPKKLPEVIPVHRLDRDTSGLMVFARSKSIALELTRLFSNHQIERRYQAIVIGQPAEMVIENYLCRDRGDGLRGSTLKIAEGELAITHVKVIEQIAGYSLIECRLETGRTHQIRIHLSEAGHLICGEPVYYKKKQGGTLKDHSDAPRLALHASNLGFSHPLTNKKLEFQVPLPADLQQFWNRLIKDHHADL